MDGAFLIVSASRENTKALRAAFGGAVSVCASEAFSAAQARRMLAERLFVNVVVDAPLADEPGADLALYAASRCSGGVILFVKRAIAERLERESSGSGVIVIPKPADREAVRISVRALEVMRGKLAHAEEEVRRLRMRLADEKTICRAKCILSARRGMDEAEAHRFIEKNAMDSRKSKREIAEEIIAADLKMQ